MYPHHILLRQSTIAEQETSVTRTIGHVHIASPFHTNSKEYRQYCTCVQLLTIFLQKYKKEENVIYCHHFCPL